MDRAVSRFQSGHINLSTLKYTYTECKHAANGTISHVHFVAANVKPSMISAMNYVQLAFDDSFTYLPSPTSRCTCVDGLGFCSHMLALIIFMTQCQLFPEEDYNWHFKRMPDFVDDIYTAIVPLQYIIRNM